MSSQLSLIEFNIPVSPGITPAYSVRRKSDNTYWDFANHVFTPTPTTATADLTQATVTINGGSPTTTCDWYATLSTTGLLAQFADGYYIAEAWDASTSPPTPLQTVGPCGPFYVSSGNDAFAPSGAAPTVQQIVAALSADGLRPDQMLALTVAGLTVPAVTTSGPNTVYTFNAPGTSTARVVATYNTTTGALVSVVLTPPS